MVFKHYFRLVLAVLFILSSVYFAFESLIPNVPKKTELETSDFSVYKAQEQLTAMTTLPHYSGSDEIEKVRALLVEELLELGFSVQIQDEIGQNREGRSTTRAQNIIAEMKGDGNGDAILMMTHYDSATHSSYGASDAGSGVVTILEGVRAFLASEPAFQNDLIILFTDAEEIGLLGAEAFVEYYEDLDKIKLALNFEARGSGGRSYMFMETNGKNRKLLDQFTRAQVQKPVANSLMYSIYKMLPNDTDLTVIREKGNIPGFNFAFIGDHFDYHTSQDIVSRLDVETLQHQGDYLLNSLVYFANADLSDLESESDDIYINIPFIKLLTYPFSWSIPLVVIAYFIFLVLLFVGLGQGKLTISGIMKGFAPLLLSVVLSLAFCVVGWRLLLNIFPQYQDILHGFTYNGYDYIAGFMAVSASICLGVYQFYIKKEDDANIAVAPIFFWIFINIGFVIFLRGANFLIIPVFFGLWSLQRMLFKTKDNLSNFLFLALLTIPLIVIMSPLVRMFPVGLGLKMMGVSAVLVVISIAIAIPFFIKVSKRKWIARLAFVGGLFFFGKAILNSEYTADQKKPNSLNYVLDLNQDKAYWETYDRELDDYALQAMGDSPSKGTYLGTTGSGKYKTGITFHQNAERLDIPFSEALYSVDSLGQNILSLKPNRLLTGYKISANEPIDLRFLEINGREIDLEGGSKDLAKGSVLTTYQLGNSKDSLVVVFKTKNGLKPKLQVLEFSHDLQDNPWIKLKERDSISMPTPFVLNDAILVKKNLE